MAMEDSANMAMENHAAAVQDGVTGDLQNVMNSVPVMENVISGMKDIAVCADMSCQTGQHTMPTRGSDPKCGLLKPTVTDDLISVSGPASEMTIPKVIQIDEALNEDHEEHFTSTKLARHKAQLTFTQLDSISKVANVMSRPLSTKMQSPVHHNNKASSFKEVQSELSQMHLKFTDSLCVEPVKILSDPDPNNLSYDNPTNLSSKASSMA